MRIENYIENEVIGINDDEIKNCLTRYLEGRELKRVLLIPPDYTRLNSGAGIITSLLYEMLQEKSVAADIMPALGTHVPMTRQEQKAFFGEDIPADKYLVHDWRGGVEKIGTIPREFVREVSEGLMDEEMTVELSKYLLAPSYDLILSIGQVVPHEVAGMANYTKNIVIGCGGSAFINQSHILGAYYGLEKVMGKDHSPVRKVFDYAEEHFISKLRVEYILTVTVTENTDTKIIGLYADKGREAFNRAVKMSQKHNMTRVSKPLKRCVVWLDESEYHSTWLGNKAVYRTRMAMADGGELIILAPGIKRFGEDEEIDKLIRKYGYAGRENILKLCKTASELRANMSAAAHLIHGSPDGRFDVVYATRHLTREDIEGVGYTYMPFEEAAAKYNPSGLESGFNILANGEEVYYIDNPALGLWVSN